MKKWLVILFLITAVPGCSFDPLGLFPRPNDNTNVVDPDDEDTTNWEELARNKTVYADIVASWKNFDKAKVGPLAKDYYGLFASLADEVADNTNIDTAKKLHDLIASSGESIGITKKSNPDFSNASHAAIVAAGLVNGADKIADKRTAVFDTLQSIASGCAAVYEGSKK